MPEGRCRSREVAERNRLRGRAAERFVHRHKCIKVVTRA
jgi:hypothetical protein